MPEPFDPYYKWLGIAPKDQPPHLYRLLGIDLFETDREVIAFAADQRMLLARSFQTGDRSELSQQILNELSAAKLCLLNPQRKQEYDQQLRTSQKPARPQGIASPQIETQPATQSEVQIRQTDQTTAREKKPLLGKLLPWIAPAISIAIVFGIIYFIRSMRDPSAPPAIAKTRHKSSGNTTPNNTNNEDDQIKDKNDKQPTTPKRGGSPDDTGSNDKPSPARETHALIPIPIEPQNIQEGETLELRIQIEDAARLKNVRYSLVGSPPSGVAIDPTSGLLRWTPTEDQGPQHYSIKVEIRHGQSIKDVAFLVDVNESNQPPVFEKTEIEPLRPGTKFQAHFKAHDSDIPKQTLSYELVTGPDGAEIDPESGEFTWVASAQGEKITPITIRVTDQLGGTDELTFELDNPDVVTTTADPLLPPPGDRSGKEDNRHDIPTSVARKVAEKQLLKKYSRDYDQLQKDPELMLSLARKFIRAADKFKGNPAEQFAMYVLAQRLALAAGSPSTTLQAIDALTARFKTDPTKARIEGLERLVRSKSLRSKAAVTELYTLVNQTLEKSLAEHRYESATKLAKMGLSIAQKLRDRDLRKKAFDRNKLVIALSQAYDSAKRAVAILKKDPRNPNANFKLGAYLVLIQSDWERGLPRLALGNNPAMRNAAEQELAQPKSGEEQKQVADSWYELANKKQEAADMLKDLPQAKKNLLDRAALWYGTSLPSLTDPTKTTVEKRLEEIAQLGGADCSSQSPVIIDDGDADFATTGGGWGFSTTGSGWVGAGYKYNAAGSGSSVATWTFTDLPAGDYQVSITWVVDINPVSNRATDAPYTIYDDTTQVYSEDVNQEQAPAADVVDSGSNFQHLGSSVTINNGTLVVKLTDDANEYVIADAVRIECDSKPAAPRRDRNEACRQVLIS